MARRLNNERFKIIRSCRPAHPTYQLNMKKWDNLGNFGPIKLKFGMQVPFTRPRATITFGDNPIIFPPTKSTYQKVAYSEIFKLP